MEEKFMNKALSNKDLQKKTLVADLKTSADIDTGNYKVFQLGFLHIQESFLNIL